MERSEPCRYATACETKTAEYTAPNDNFSLLRRGTIEIQESSPATDQVHELPRNHKLGEDRHALRTCYKYANDRCCFNVTRLSFIGQRHKIVVGDTVVSLNHIL